MIYFSLPGANAHSGGKMTEYSQDNFYHIFKTFHCQAFFLLPFYYFETLRGLRRCNLPWQISQRVSFCM